MSLLARSRLLILCGCVLFAFFKPHGVPLPRAVAESLNTMQRLLCVLHTCVAHQISSVFECVGYAYVFEPAILPHLPPAFLWYKSLPSPVYAGVYTVLLIHCALSMVTAVCVRTAVCTQLSLCVFAVCLVHAFVAYQYSSVFACVRYAYVFQPAILPHLPPAFLRYKSLPSPVYASGYTTLLTLRTQHGHSSMCTYSGVHTAFAVCLVHAFVAHQYSCVFAYARYA